MNVIEVSNLTKKYPSFLLDNVSFDIEESHICGFIGKNGAGKTTTIKSILNLVHADSGEVKCFGKSFLDNESELKQKIGYSTGAVNYYPRKKIKDIVAVTKSFYPQWDDEAYRKYLEIFELDENKTPRELSEGMKVKFNLLLALSHNAQLLILDEPTSGLDPFSRDDLLEIFKLLKQNGTAILFSTHIVSDLEKCADDIVYIKKGKIFASMPKAEFKEKYKENNETLEETVLRLERE